MNNNKKWFGLIGVSIATFLGCVDFTIVNTILPAIQKDLSATVTQLQWVINIFILNLCALMVVTGRLGDVYGHRKAFYIGMLFFTLSSLGASLAPTIDMLLLFRLLQGASAAILYSGSGGIITHHFPPNLRAKALGILFGINGLGLCIGPVLGGLIEGLSTWRWVFLINVPVMILSFVFCMPNLSESKNTDTKSTIDWWGTLLLILSLSSLIVALVNGEHWGWFSLSILLLFSTAILSGIIFYIVEKHSEAPIIQFDLFKNSLYITSVIAQFFMAFFYTLAFFMMPLYLHFILGFTGISLGLLLLPTTAIMALCSPLLTHAITRYGPKRFIAFGFLSLALSGLIQYTFTIATPLWVVCVGFGFLGLGWGCILNPSTVSAMSSIPPSASAVAMGSVWTFHNIGGAIGLSIGTALYHFLSKKSLLDSLPSLTQKSWIPQAIARPELAPSLIEQYTRLTEQNASKIANHAFISGYEGVMLLLTITSVLAFLVIVFVMPPAKAKVEIETDVLGESEITDIP